MSVRVNSPIHRSRVEGTSRTGTCRNRRESVGVVGTVTSWVNVASDWLMESSVTKVGVEKASCDQARLVTVR